MGAALGDEFREAVEKCSQPGFAGYHSADTVGEFLAAGRRPAGSQALSSRRSTGS